jgi:hypothetical protein
MNRSILTTMALGTALLCSGAAFAAAPSVPTATTPIYIHRVHFDLRNDTMQVITVQAGVQQFTVAPGKSMSVKLPIGTNLVAENSTPNRAAGTLLVQVGTALGDKTVVLK